MQQINMPDFNEYAGPPLYTCNPSPVNPRAYVIMRNKDEKGNEAVGDYTVLDSDENPELTQKKVSNLVSLLNGRKKLMQLGHETKSRILYKIVRDLPDDNMVHVIFYHLGTLGNSVENALLRIERNTYEH